MIFCTIYIAVTTGFLPVVIFCVSKERYAEMIVNFCVFCWQRTAGMVYGNQRYRMVMNFEGALGEN